MLQSPKLARSTTLLILALDLYVGLVWLLGDPRRTTSRTFQPLRDLFDALPVDPVRAWGGLLAVIAFAAVATLVFQLEKFGRAVLVAGASYWAFWAVLNVFAMWQPQASLSAPAFAVIVILAHSWQPLDNRPQFRR